MADKSLVIGDRTVIALRPDLGLRVYNNDSAILIGSRDNYVLDGPGIGLVLSAVRKPVAVANLLESVQDLSAPYVFYNVLRLLRAGIMLQDSNAVSNACAIAKPRLFLTRHGHKSYAVKSFHNLDDFLMDTAAAIRQLGLGEPVLCEQADVTIVLVRSYVDPGLTKVLQDILDHAARVLLLKIGAAEIWIGPEITLDCIGSWEAVQQRLSENLPFEAEALSWPDPVDIEALFPIVLGAEAQRATAVGVTRFLSDEEPIGQMIKRYDLAIHEISEHRFRGIIPKTQQRRPLDLAEWIGSSGAPRLSVGTPRTAAWEDGGLRSREPADTLEKIRPLMSDLTGLIPHLAVYEEDGAVIAYTGQTIPNCGGLSENRRLGRRLAAVGKGETELQATLSCACEAIERYSACYQGSEEIISASYQAVAGLSLDPTALFGFSARQYERRDELNRLYGDFNRIPEPLPQDVPISWTPVSSAHDGEQKLVPASFGFFNFWDNEQSERFYFGDSNGCAAGNTAEEAILQGLYELIERDACAIWWYNRLSRSALSTLESADDFPARALDFYARRSRSFSLIDLTTDIRVPVIAAVSANARGQDIHVGLGCNLDLRIAISRAISELHQSYLLGNLPKRPDAATLNKDLDDWLANGSLDQYQYLCPLGRSDAAELQDLSSRTVEGDLHIVLNLLESKRLEVFIQDLSRPEAILPVFRVIVPGLRHFWARFAPGRLYDAPVAMAILDAPRAEHELNATPFFL